MYVRSIRKPYSWTTDSQSDNPLATKSNMAAVEKGRANCFDDYKLIINDFNIFIKITTYYL